MKTQIFLISVMALMCCCQEATIADSAIEYQIDQETYAIVVPQEEGMSDEDAKQLALKKAKEVAKSHNFQYITIEKEEKGTFASTRNNPQLPKNLYYEDIQTQNFGKDRNIGGPTPYTTPAYKITFKGYKEKPMTLKKVIDVNS